MKDDDYGSSKGSPCPLIGHEKDMLVKTDIQIEAYVMSLIPKRNFLRVAGKNLTPNGKTKVKRRWENLNKLSAV